MTSLSRVSGWLLSGCFLWALVLQFALVCPCQGHGKIVEMPTEASGCCPSNPKQPSDCCSSESKCHHCPLCLSSALVAPAIDNPRMDLVFEATVAAPGPVDVTVTSNYLSLLDRPPDRVRLAPHISTTVLRC